MLLISDLSGVSVSRPEGTALLGCPLEQTWGSAAPGVVVWGWSAISVPSWVMSSSFWAQHPKLPISVVPPCAQLGEGLSTAGASQLELAYGVTGKLQIYKTMEHLGISCVTSCWLEASDY